MEIISNWGWGKKQLSQCAYDGHYMSWNEAWVLKIQ